jgi:hypothetical protein
MTVQPIAASNISKWYAISDAKIFPMLTDPPDAVPTYGPALDVPGIKSLIISGSTDTKELRGDNMLLDTSTVITSMDGTFEYAKLDLDVQTVLVGGIVQEQTDPPASAWDWGTSDYATAGYWMIIGRTPTADTPTGDCWLMVYKCKVASFPELGFAEEDYKTFSVDFSALELQGVKKTLGIRYNDEAGNIVVPTFCPAAVGGALDDLAQLVPADCTPTP